MQQHFIITPFSIRKEYFKRKKARDPLRSKSLDHRFKVFEITCLPSVLSQINQDFTWIILIDPELPEYYRNRLIKMVAAKADTHLFEFYQNLNIHKLGWLKPWIDDKTQFVITTIIDDDDALSCGFTEYFKPYLNELSENSKIPPILFFGCRNFIYWDFYHSKNASLGYQKKDNDKNYITGAGLTICAKYPEMNFSVMHFPHHLFNALANQNNESYHFSQSEAAYVYRIDSLFKSAASQFMPCWDGILGPENFHIIETESPLVIVLNHLENIQYRRIFINQENRIPVSASESFKYFDINFTLAQRYIKRFRKTPFLIIRLIINHFLVFPGKERDLSLSKLMYVKLRSLPQVIKGYSKL